MDLLGVKSLDLIHGSSSNKSNGTGPSKSSFVVSINDILDSDSILFIFIIYSLK